MVKSFYGPTNKMYKNNSHNNRLINNLRISSHGAKSTKALDLVGFDGDL